MCLNKTGSSAAILALAFLVGFLALIQIFVLATGAIGIFLTQPLAYAFLFGALSGALGLCYNIRQSKQSGDELTLPADSLQSRVPQSRFVVWIGWTIGIGMSCWALWQWIRMLQIAWLRPPYDWDGLYYHVPAIHGWVQKGFVHFNSTILDNPFVNYPMGQEAFSFWLHQLTGSSQLVDAGNLWYWPLAFISLVVVAAELGTHGGWRWLTGALLTGAPIMIIQSATCYVDISFSASVMATFAASFVLLRLTTTNGVTTNSWPEYLLWGASLGLMIGNKGTGLPFGIIIVTVVLAAQNKIFKIAFSRPSIINIFAAGFTATLVGSYWYLRNWISGGNPIYPLELKFGEKVIFEGWNHRIFLQDNIPDWLASYPSVLQTPVSWLQLDAPVKTTDPVSGLGYIWVYFGIPALLFLGLLAIKQRHQMWARLFGTMAALFLIMLAFQPASWWSRFTIWLHILGLPAITLLVFKGLAQKRAIIIKIMSIVLVLSSCSTVAWEANRALVMMQQTGKISANTDGEARYQATVDYLLPTLSQEPFYADFWNSKHIARNTWGTTGTLFGGALSLPLTKRKITVLSPYLDQAYIELLQNEEVNWICWDTSIDGELPKILKDCASNIFTYYISNDTIFYFLHLAPKSTRI